jgi:predicted MPP superfamily phosphohydrolase
MWEDQLKIDQAFAGTKENDCRILLSHNPDSVDTPFKTPLALVMSGHTHGGQVRLPFYGPPVLPVENKHYSSGLIDTPKTKLFISRGIGWAIYPVRFNCYPEIAVLELVRQAS